MTEFNSLFTEKENILDRVIKETKKRLSIEILKRDKKIYKLKMKNLRNYVSFLKKKKFNLSLNRKIIYKSRNNPVDYSNVDLKLEDLNAFRMVLSQIEVKEKKIIDLKKNGELLSKKNNELSNAYEQNKDTISKLTNSNNKLISDVENLKKHLHKTKEELSNKLQDNEDLEKAVFELEGIKKIQYETIYSLKNDIKKQKDELIDLKIEFKGIVDEFNKILNIFEEND